MMICLLTYFDMATSDIKVHDKATNRKDICHKGKSPDVHHN